MIAASGSLLCQESSQIAMLDFLFFSLKMAKLKKDTSNRAVGPSESARLNVI